MAGGETIGENATITAGNGSTADLACNLGTGYSFILQTVLGVLAFSTLILKRYREPVAQRRPFWIWTADTVKQALGMIEIHFVNLGLASLLRQTECTTYLINFLLDSTAGLLLIFILLKIVALLVSCYNVVPLKSGEYGEPFRIGYWLAQCGVYLAVMLVEKLVTGPIAALHFWGKIEHILPRNEKFRVAIVIFVVPFIVNVVMFWIVDSILMRKIKKDLSKTPSVHYHRSGRGYDQVPMASSDSESEDEDELGQTAVVIATDDHKSYNHHTRT